MFIYFVSFKKVSTFAVEYSNRGYGNGGYYFSGNQGFLECRSYYVDFRVSRYKLAHLC